MLKELFKYFRDDTKAAVLDLLGCTAIFIGGFTFYILLALFI